MPDWPSSARQPIRRSERSSWPRSASRRGHRPGSTRRRLDAVPGARRGAGAARPGSRGHPLGGRRAARLHRVPRALGRGPDRHPLPGPPRAARPASDLGRRHPECGDDRPRAAQRRRDRPAGRRPARGWPARRRFAREWSAWRRATRSSPRSSSGCSSIEASFDWRTAPGSWPGRSRRSRSRRRSRPSSPPGSTGCPGDEKRLAQNAAVVGRIFWDVLRRPSRAARVPGRPATCSVGCGSRSSSCRASRRRWPAPRSSASAMSSSVTWPTTRCRSATGATLHVDVAGWAEATLADRIDEFAELVAGHLAAALAYEEELDDRPRRTRRLRELRELVYRAAVRAARRAASVSASRPPNAGSVLAIDQARPARAASPRADAVLRRTTTATSGTSRSPPNGSPSSPRPSGSSTQIPDPTDDDRQVHARLQGALARGDATRRIELEAAQAILRDGIAALAGRAAEPRAGRPPARPRLDALADGPPIGGGADPRACRRRRAGERLRRRPSLGAPRPRPHQAADRPHRRRRRAARGELRDGPAMLVTGRCCFAATSTSR